MIEGCFAISPSLSMAVSHLLMDLGLPKKALQGAAGSNEVTEIRVKREVSQVLAGVGGGSGCEVAPCGPLGYVNAILLLTEK